MYPTQIPGEAISLAGCVIDVRQAGATGNGRTLDTAAINRAIQDCAQAGGGVVRFPVGCYRSTTIHLASDVSLYLDAGARLVGCDDCEQYDQLQSKTGTPRGRWNRALLMGENVRRVTIGGPGGIDGRRVYDAQGEETMRGPHTILLENCAEIVLRDFLIVDAANYAILMLGCDNVEIRQLRIEGGWDGVHFRGSLDKPCRNVDIVNCQMFTGDDCIAGGYWEDCLVSGCVLNSSCNPVRVISPIRRVIFQDCLMYGPGRFEHRTTGRTNALAGIILQPGAWMPQPGLMDDVLLSRLTMHNVSTPLMVVSRKDTPCGRIIASNITATGVYRAACSFESWGDEPIGQIVLRDCSFDFNSPAAKADEVDVEIKDPDKESRLLPVWGLYARNVGRLEVDNVRLHHAEPDGRPAVLGQGVGVATLDELRLPSGTNRAQAIRVNNAK